jgi:hypothetical protein
LDRVARRRATGAADAADANADARLRLAGPTPLRREERSMNLFVWLPAMFALGLVSLGVCYAFVFACEDI